MKPNNGGDFIFRDETGEPKKHNDNDNDNDNNNNDRKLEARPLLGDNIAVNGNDSIPKALDTNPTVEHEMKLSIPRPLSRKDLRRKNRRRLHRLLKKPGAQPSFLRIIEEKKKTIVRREPNSINAQEVVVVEDDDSDDDFLLEPPKVVIDVDAYLGLKKRRTVPEEILSAEMVPSHGSIPSIITSSNGIAPMQVPSTSHNNNNNNNSNNDNTSATISNRWFQGTCPMAMQPEDSLYLTENQQYIRKHMEFFTATQDDIAAITHRKSPMVLGRVGFRCISCAQAVQYGITPRMPPASVSFPKNYAALYNLTIQKQQMHIDDCIFIPENEKWKKTGAKPRKRKLTTFPALEYWKIACKRLGIVEVENNEGLRFSRDPKLKPLSFQSIQAQVKQEQSNPIATTPTMVPSSAAGNFVTTKTTTNSAAAIRSPVATIHHPKEVADLLDEVKREREDMAIHLISKEEVAILSDFMFLTIQQATYCHAVAEDFATRGKKTKLMRIGYAGFCCRHCKRNYRPGGELNLRVFQNSCRSFASSRDNIGSAMSNSFVFHLLKCDYTPHNIKYAMQTLKKVHSKQMSGLPYGSQSSVFEKIWKRIRASDKPKESGVVNPNKPKITTSPRDTVAKAKNNDDNDEYLPHSIASLHTGTNRHLPRKSRVSRQQPISLPPIDDVECRRVLKDAEENWDESQNDHLIQKEDKGLISDFVFLCMRQLKVAIPNGSDFRLNRPRRIAGVCCRHCTGVQSTSRTASSGRSFPSAPDNIASILNVTMFKHLMNCPSVPTKLKQTIDSVRKSHTKQCASLRYGSQRRYFEKLFERLRNVPIEGVLVNTTNEPKAENEPNLSSAIHKCEFVRTNTSDGSVYWQCLKCRMVPYDYRAPGSIFFSTPSIVAMEEHRMVCQNDGVYWKSLRSSMKKLSIHGWTFCKPLLLRESFTNLIRSVVGSEEGVCDTYMKMFRDETLPSFHRDIWRRLPVKVDYDLVQKAFSELRRDICLPPAYLSDCAEMVEFLQRVSCNFQIPPASEQKKEAKATPQNTRAYLDDSTYDSTESALSTLAPEHEEESEVIDDLDSNLELSSHDRSFGMVASSISNGTRTTSTSGDVQKSLTTKATRTVQDPQNHFNDDPGGMTVSNQTPKQEISTVDQTLTQDQGGNVMDNTGAEQFDDPLINQYNDA